MALKIGTTEFAGTLALAPMAGVTNLPFRTVCREQGCSLGFTEMISTEGLLREHQKTQAMVAHHPCETDTLGIQIFGDDPQRLAEAARWVQDHTPVRVLNINMGCPVPKVTKRNGGASLLRDPLRIGQIVSAVKAVARVPVTIKIRSGWDEQTKNYLTVLKVAEDNGADALICHPRTRSQGYTGAADWNVIRDLVMHARIPIFGNGDIFTAEDVRKVINITKCPAVMIARGANGNPWIFRALEGPEKDRPYSSQEVGEVVLRHLSLAHETFGPSLGLKLMKRHLAWYSKWGRGDRKAYRRDVMALQDMESGISLVQKFFQLDEDSETEVFPWWKEHRVLDSDEGGVQEACAEA